MWAMLRRWCSDPGFATPILLPRRLPTEEVKLQISPFTSSLVGQTGKPAVGCIGHAAGVPSRADHPARSPISSKALRAVGPRPLPIDWSWVLSRRAPRRRDRQSRGKTDIGTRFSDGFLLAEIGVLRPNLPA